MQIPEASEPQTFFADILLPVPIPTLFTYRIPGRYGSDAVRGQRVIVQFGDRKVLTGLIVNIHHTPPAGYEAKSILEILDDLPVVTEQQLNLFRWMSEYYLCTSGEVLKAALPAGLKLSSESMVQLHPGFNLDESVYEFSDREHMLLTHLKVNPMSYSDISRLLEVRNLYSIIKSLVAKGAILIFEEVKEKYKPKLQHRVRLTANYRDPEKIEALFQELSTKPGQEAIVLKYLQVVNILHDQKLNEKGISIQHLSDGLSASSLKTLVKNGVFEKFTEIVSRFDDGEEPEFGKFPLSVDQKSALNEILNGFKTRDIVLLHGVTGSGKTAVYIHLIQQALEGGSQVLYLLPEIALTTQIVQRLKKIFGQAMGVYHSRFSDNERVEVWNGVLNGHYKFVVGVRSSVFLPFDNLGLVIVDEEHDGSYKQYEPAPRYHARDVAMVLGKFHHAKVLLGSATPAIETYFHTQTGRYGLVTLDKRFGDAQLPEIVIADLSKERREKKLKGEFSSLLLKRIETALTSHEQVIIFQNRRGYSPLINCEDCGWIPKCVNCSVSLTYHQYRHALICHYCGYREALPIQCPTCASRRIKTVGVGTERLQEELSLYFPDASVQRMDLDTTRSRTGYESILDNFEKGETDILVGTQMVTKGLDFDRVHLVGIFNADRMMHFPDFRSYERAYQLITQVSGRAGRRERPGVVVIQTNQPDHTLLQHVLRDDFRTFYMAVMDDRNRHFYPPFSRLVEIVIKNTHHKNAKSTADALAVSLRETLPAVRILGPGTPMISKIRNQYLMNILIKIPRGAVDLQELKFKIAETAEKLGKEKNHRSSRIQIDVDPL